MSRTGLGKILLLAILVMLMSGCHMFLVSAYQPDGTLDTSVDTDGYITTAFETADANTIAEASDIIVDGQNTKVVAGSTVIDGRQLVALSAYTDGSLAPVRSFSGDGQLLIDFSLPAHEGYSDVFLKLDRNLDYLVLAQAKTDTCPGQIHLARLNGNGSFDTTFGTGGKLRLLLPPFTDGGTATEQLAIHSMAVDWNNRIVLAGSLYSLDPGSLGCDFPRRNMVIRLLSDGRLDPSFGAGRGYILVDIPGFLEPRLYTVSIPAYSPSRPAPKILVGGAADIRDASSAVTYNQPYVLRLNNDGSEDASFGDGGISRPSVPETFNGTEQIITGTDGRIYGRAWRYGDETNRDNIVLFRLLNSGRPDPTFGTGGIVTTSFQRSSDIDTHVTDMMLDKLGNLILAGYVTGSYLNMSGFVASLNSYGGINAAFGLGGVVYANPPYSQRSEYRAVAQDHYGRIISVGSAMY